MELPVVLYTGSLVLIRIVAMVMTAPVLGHRAVPIRIRLVLAITLTLLACPLVAPQAATDVHLGQWLNSALGEITIGLLLGLGVTLVFVAAQMVGTVISQMAAIQFPGMDSEANSSSPVPKMFGLLSLAAFALMNGPELVIGATLDTFVQLPLGMSLETESVLDLTLELLRQSMLLTLRGVGPAVAAMLASSVVIGLISRSFPQANLLSLGLNSNLAIMLLSVFFTVGGCVWLFADDFQQIVATIQSGLKDAVVSVESPILDNVGSPFAQEVTPVVQLDYRGIVDE